MLLKKYKNILFDLDGTLIDTGEGIINSIFYCIKEKNLKKISLEEAKLFVGPPLMESFIRVFHLTEEEARECVKTFRIYYSKYGKLECSPYPYIKEVLETLLQRGYRLFVATSKPTVFAEEILLHFDLAKYFSDIVGSNLDNSRSKKVDIINYVIDNYNLKREDTLMIGDKDSDIFGAQKSGINSLGVLYGYGSLEEIKNACPTLMADNVEDIIK